MSRLLPWEYGVRNLLRRPSRSLLTLGGMTVVMLLVLVVISFLRGLEASLVASGRPNVVLVYGLASGSDLENSAISAATPGLVEASIPGIVERYGVPSVSPELYLGTRIRVGDRSQEGLGLVRGVTTTAPLLRCQVQLLDGAWPGPREVLIGNLAHSKLGCLPADLALGNLVHFDGGSWRISGHFAAAGSAFESELWCPLSELQTALHRQDLSLVAVGVRSRESLADLQLFCQERRDLELKAIAESDYYAALQQHYRPLRMLCWAVVLLIAGSGIFTGLNTMYGAVVSRVRELATLQAMGYRRRAILVTLVQESVLLAAGGALIACGLALWLVHGKAIRFTMGAFVLRVDSVAIAWACGVALLLGLVGSLPPAIKALRISVVEAIKAI